MAMAHEQLSECATQAEKNKALFVFGVIWVIDQLGVLIDEDGSRLFKRDTVFLRVDARLVLIPLEAKCAHLCILTTM